MNDSVRQGLIYLCLLFVLAACRQQLEPVPLSFSSPVWEGGELSMYTVTTSRGEPIGTAQVEILSTTTDGATVWLMRRQTVAQNMQEISEIVINEATFRPIRSTLVLTDSAGQQTVEALYRGGNVDITLVSKLGLMHTEQRSIPTDSYDANTAFSLLRALPFTEGYATQLNLFTPFTGFLETLTIHVVGRQQVAIPAGNFDAWQIDLIKGETVTQMWIGAAAPFPVVKWIDGGTRVTFELLAFRPGPKN